MAYCTQCGAPLPKTGRFCTQCGTAFAAGVAASAADNLETQLIQGETFESQQTRVVQPEGIEDQETQLIAPESAEHATVPKPETSGIDQFVMDIPQQAVVYPSQRQEKAAAYVPPAPVQRVYMQPRTPAIPDPPQKESRWPVVVIAVSIVVIIAAAVFAVWWFLLR